MPWLRTGTVACTLNSTTVTGTGTGFVANARVGDAFLGPDGRWYEVANIASDTALSILPAYLGATVSAGAYALAPMQGYVKDSADQLRALVNKFGTLAASASVNALAAITGGANKIAYFTAADQMALADFPAQARTFLTAATQVTQRTALGLGSSAVAPIVGTVSQASGVPTGAIVETGTNANGTYTKWADGTMICTRSLDVSTALSTQLGSSTLYYNASTGVVASQQMPASFIALPKVHAQLTCDQSTTGWLGGFSTPSTSAWGTCYLLEAFARTSQTYHIYLTAIGRWF